MNITENQIQALRDIGDKANRITEQIIGSKSFNDLPSIAYARHEYWAGKAIAISEVFKILMKGG